MRFPSKPKLSQRALRVANPRRLSARILRIEALERMLVAQPGELPFRKLSRCGNAAADRLLQLVLTLQVSPELAVAHGTHGGMPRMQVRAFVQHADFLEKTLRHHGVKAFFE